MLPALPGEQYVRRDMVRVGDFREGIEAVVHAVRKLPADVSRKVGDGLLPVQKAADGDCLDQHRHGPLQAGVASAIADCGIQYVLLEAVPAQDEGERRVQEGAFRQAVLLAEVPDLRGSDL